MNLRNIDYKKVRDMIIMVLLGGIVVVQIPTFVRNSRYNICTQQVELYLIHRYIIDDKHKSKRYMKESKKYAKEIRNIRSRDEYREEICWRLAEYGYP